jgi:galactonate dehydratase
MKIRDANCWLIPWTDQRNWVIVTIETEGGLVGFGEGTLYYPVCQSARIKAAFEECKSDLIGRDAGQIQLIWRDMFDRHFWRGGPASMTTLGAIDTALWDLAGKAAGLPIHRLLGGRCRDTVRTYENGWWVGETGSEDLAEKARQAVANGAHALKWYPFRSLFNKRFERPLSAKRLNDAIADVHMVRRAVGDDVDLMVDIWRCLDVQSALRFCREVEALNLLFVEEPIVNETAELLLQLSSATNTRIATGERLLNKWEFKPVIERRAVSVIQPDLPRVGGITEAQKIAALAEVNEIYLAPHNPTGTVATAASIHFCAAWPNFTILEMFSPADTSRREDFILDGVTTRNGYASIPEKPGLGVEVDISALRRLAK